MTKRKIVELLEKKLEKNIELEKSFINEWGNKSFRKKLDCGLTIKDFIREDRKVIKQLLEPIKNSIKTNGRKIGAEKAREVLQIKTRDKVENAIHSLRFNGKDVTPYQVAKVSGVSYNTARKYLKMENDFKIL